MLKTKLAPVEINLISMPFYRISDRKPKLEDIKYPDGTQIIFGQGKPSVLGQDLLIYILSKVQRKKVGKDTILDTEKLRKEGISFTLAELCEHLSIDKNNSRNRKRIRLELEKLGKIIVSYYESFLTKRNDKEVRATTIRNKALMEITFFDPLKSEAQLPLWENKIYFDDLVITNLQKNFYRLYDPEKYVAIANPVAKRVLAILELHNQTKVWLCGLLVFAEKVSIEAKQVFHIRNTLKTALEYLLVSNHLKSYRIYKNKEKIEVIEFTFK